MHRPLLFVLCALTLAACTERTNPVAGQPPVGGLTPNAPFAFAMGGILDDEARHIASDSAGNTFLLGTFSGTADFNPSTTTEAKIASGANDLFVAKYDSVGAFVWATALGGAGVETAGGIALDASGNVVITGSMSAGAICPGFGGVLTNVGGRDVFVAKLTSAGQCTWAFTVGSLRDDEPRALGIDATGNIYVAGLYAGSADFDPSLASRTIAPVLAADTADVFVAKYTAGGNYVWVNGVGGKGRDEANALLVGTSGEVFVGGAFADTVDFDPLATFRTLASRGDQDAFIARYEADGRLGWAQAGGGTGKDVVQWHSIALNTVTDLIVAGTFTGSANFSGLFFPASLGLNDIFVTRWDPVTGLFKDGWKAGGTGDDVIRALWRDPTGGALYLAGSFQGTVDFAIGQLLTGAVVTTPIITSPVATGSAGSDLFIASYSAGGAPRWARAMTAAPTNSALTTAYGVVAGPGGTIWMTGRFANATDMDPSSSLATLTSAGGADIPLVRFTRDSGNVKRR